MFDCEERDFDYNESKVAAYLADGSEGKDEQVIEDLFGNPIVLRTKRQAMKHTDTPYIPVTCKLSHSDFQDLKMIAAKFGMKVSSYVRDCVRQQIADHKCILQP